MKYLWIFLLLTGCTSYSETRTSSFPFHAEGSSTINVYIEGVDVATSRQTGQEATSEADLKAALSQAAATAVATGREAILDDILNKFKAEANQTDSNNDNSVTPAPVPVSVPTPKKPSPEPSQNPVVDPPADPIVPSVDPPLDSPINLSDVEWLHTDVSGWTETGKLKSVSTSSSSITLDYDKANVWPSKEGLNANPWVFIKQDGKWYGATWEWMREGQTTKSKSAVAGDHIKKSPLKNWEPKIGETYGFMVSGLARDTTRNTEERTNVVMYKWK